MHEMILSLALGGLGTGAVQGAVQKEAEYKRSDAEYYLKSDVMKAVPGAVIVPESGLTQRGESYFYKSPKKAPAVIYAQVSERWIEPITPPDMPASLSIAPDAMQVREPQGDVQVAEPNAPATYFPATDGLLIPNGTVIKTGADGTAAVLFGGVSSARFMPGSQAAVQQTVTAQARSTEVDLTSGGVFSKVGKQPDVTEDYVVQAPGGSASARGTDFVTLAMPQRTDVWIAQGTVEVKDHDGKTAGVATADGTGVLKMVRSPVITGLHAVMVADAETMTDALNFIPMADQKIKPLLAKTSLTPAEQAYLDRIEQITCLIRLSRVDEPPPVTPVAVTPIAPPAPPVSPPATMVTPASSAPAAEVTPPTLPAPAPAPTVPPNVVTSPAPTANAPAVPLSNGDVLDVQVRADNKVEYQGSTITLAQLKLRLREVARVTPGQAVVLHLDDKATQKQADRVLALCKTVELKNVSVASANSAAPPAPLPLPAAAPAAAASGADGNLPSPSFLMRPDTMPTNAPSSPPPENSTPATNAPSP